MATRNITMNLSSIGFVIWGVTCGLSSIILLLLRQKPNQGIWKLYLQYLLIHTVLSGVWLIDYGLNQGDPGYDNSTAHKVLSWLIRQFMLYAARLYFEIGTVILFRFKMPHHRIMNISSWILFILFSITLCALSFAITSFKQGDIIVYAFYCPCALYALIGLYMAYFRVLRRDQTSSITVSDLLYDLGIPDTQGSVLACSGKTSAIVLLGVIGGTIGMLDFQLPALEYIGVPVWESTFLGRLLDCILYIPLIIPCLMWIDCPTNYQTEMQH